MKILASDYDYTLHFKDGIKPKDLEMIQTFRSNGGLFGLVSGRAISSLLHEVHKYQIPYDFLIGVNGGFILDNGGHEIFKTTISTKTAKALIQYLNKHTPQSYTLHNGYDLARKIFTEDFKLNIDLEFKDIDTLFEKPVSGFFINYKTEEDAMLAQLDMNKKFPDVYAQQNANFVDITAPNVNKARGIQKLIDHENWGHDVWVIGDGQNDKEMIENFNSFAMKDGYLLLHEIADHVVDSIAEAIEILLAM